MKQIRFLFFQFSRVKEKGLLKSLRAVLYLFLFKCFLFYDKNLASFFIKEKIYIIDFCKDERHNVFSVDYFLKQCDLNLNNKEYIQYTNRVIEGYVLLFEKEFKLNLDDLLEDPISKLSWESKSYFYDSKVEVEGLGDVKYVMQVNKMYHLVDLAKAYYITKEVKYLNSIKKYLVCWDSQVDYKSSVVNKITLDRSFRVLNLIQVSFLCEKSDLYNKEILPIILEILKKEESRIRLFLTSRWHKLNDGANHSIGEIVSLISVQLFLDNYLKANYRNKIERELKKLNEVLEKIISRKGVYLEQSGNYSKLVAEFLMFLDVMINMFYSSEIPYYYEESYFRKLVNYLRLIQYDNRVLNFGDNDGASAFYSIHNFKNKKSAIPVVNYKENFIDTSKDYLVCKDSGQFVYNTEQVMFFVRSGQHSYFPSGSSSHSHNDILSLLLGIKSKMVFIDYGTFLYNSGMKFRRRDLYTSNHNTVSLGGLEQACFVGKWSYKNYPDSNIKQADVSEFKVSFQGQTAYDDLLHNRKINYIFEEKKLVIIDDLSSEKQTNYKLNFLLNPIFDIQIVNEKIEILLHKRLFCYLKIATNGTIGIVKSRYSPSYGVEQQTNRLVVEGEMLKEERIITEIFIND